MWPYGPKSTFQQGAEASAFRDESGCAGGELRMSATDPGTDFSRSGHRPTILLCLFDLPERRGEP